MSSKDKIKSKSVSLPPELWLRIEAKAASQYDGNRSNYAKVLFERDLAAESFSPVSQDIVYALAKVLCGELDADELNCLLNGKSQPHILRDLLRSELTRLRLPR